MLSNTRPIFCQPAVTSGTAHNATKARVLRGARAKPWDSGLGVSPIISSGRCATSSALCIGDRPRLLHGSGSLRLSLRLGQVPSAKCQVRLGLVDLRALQVRDLELVLRQLEVRSRRQSLAARCAALTRPRAAGSSPRDPPSRRPPLPGLRGCSAASAGSGVDLLRR